MKEYEFLVILNGGYCDGTLYIDADNYDEAWNKAINEVADALQEFPVTVIFDVECIKEPDDEE